MRYMRVRNAHPRSPTVLKDCGTGSTRGILHVLTLRQCGRSSSAEPMEKVNADYLAG